MKSNMFKLFLDPGHGGSDPGAVANGLKEKDLTLTIAKRVREILAHEYEDLAIKMSRSNDTTVTLRQRTDEANAWGADYYLSIHINSGGGEGFETFIYLNTDSQTQEAQRVIHDAIIQELQVKDRGVKRENFHVLRESRMKALLTETLFVDNVRDSDLLKNPDFLERAARGHVNGLERAFKLKRKGGENMPENEELKTEQTGETSPNSGELFRVQVGAFADKERAEQLGKELSEKGYPVYIVSNNE